MENIIKNNTKKIKLKKKKIKKEIKIITTIINYINK